MHKEWQREQGVSGLDNEIAELQGSSSLKLSAQTEETHIREQSLLLYLELSCPQHLKQHHVLSLSEFPRVLHPSRRTLTGSGTSLAVLL